MNTEKNEIREYNEKKSRMNTKKRIPKKNCIESSKRARKKELQKIQNDQRPHITSA